MKLINLLDSYHHRRKLGAEVMALGGPAVFGSILDYEAQTEANDVSYQNVQNQIQAQREENQLNRDWQTEQAEIARGFTTSERLAQQQYQTGTMEKQQQYNVQNLQEQARLNSPVYQSAELRQAHLNPQVYFGNKASFSGASLPSSPSPGSAPSGASSPMPGSVQGLSPVPLSYNPVRFSESLKNVGSLVESLASASRQNAQAKETLGLLTHKIREQMFVADQAESLATMQRISAVVQKSNFPITLKRAVAEYDHVVTEINLKKEQINTEKAQQRLDDAYSRLQDEISKLTGKQADRLGLEMPYVVAYMNSQIKENLGQAAAGYATAENQKATAEQQRLFNKIYSDKRYQHSIISQAVTAGQQAIDANKMTKKQVEHMNYMIEQAAYANDMKEFKFWSDQIQSYVGAVGEAASAFYGAGALRELVKMRQLQRMPATSIQGFK